MAEEPIRKEDIIDGAGIIAEIKELIGLLKNDLVGALDAVKKSAKEYGEVLKTANPASDEGRQKIKQTTTEIDGLAQETNQLTESQKKLIAIEEKVIATYTESYREEIKHINILRERNKEVADEIKLEKLAEGSLAKMRLQLAALKKAYTEANPAARGGILEGLQKTDKEVKKLEADMGVFSRNVGNYPKMLGAIGNGFSQVSSAIGGAVGQVGDAISSFLTAGGVVGVLSAGVGLLAKAWNTTRENIELYLSSADKLAAGTGGFERDADKARLDARKRAEGEFAEGLRITGEAQTYLLKHASTLTEEQKKYYESLVASGQQMIINGRKAITETYGIKNKHEWTRKYNLLLIEQEKINDEKLEKETKWEALEAKLTQQRSIVSTQGIDELEKKKAANSADEISKQLAKEKTDFVDRQLVNLNAIADITRKQEVYEDQINGLIKEKNTIQKEYYSDQIKVNKLENAANKDSKESKKATEEKAKLDKDGYDNYIKYIKDEKAAKKSEYDYIYNLAIQEYEDKKKMEKELLDEAEKNYKTYEDGKRKVAKEEYDWIYNYAVAEMEAETQKRKEKDEEIRQAISDSLNAIQDISSGFFQNKMNQLDRERNKELSNKNLTEAQKDEINKKYAYKEKEMAKKKILVNTALAVMQIWATSGPWWWKLVQSALVMIEGGWAYSQANSQQFGEGGDIKGKSHSQGGTMIEAEGGEYIVKKSATAKYHDLIEAINKDNPMAIAEEIRNRNFHTVWGGVSAQLSSVTRQDPYTRKMYELMVNDIKIYNDSNGDTVINYPDGRKRIVRKYTA